MLAARTGDLMCVAVYLHSSAVLFVRAGWNPDSTHGLESLRVRSHSMARADHENPLDRACASSMYGPMSSLRFRIASGIVAMIAVSSAGLSGCVHHRDYVLPIDVARGALQCAGGPIQTVMIDDRTRGVIGCNRHVAVILTCEYQRAGASTL